MILINLTFNSKAFGNANSNLLEFNKWLNINGYEQYLDKTSDPIDMFLDRSLCSPKSTWECVDADGKPIPAKDRKAISIFPNNLNIKIMKKGGGSEIHYKANPNFGTLLFYVFQYLDDANGFDSYFVQPSKNPVKFKSNLIDDKTVKKQFQTKAILSYLYFENDKIIIDEITLRIVSVFYLITIQNGLQCLWVKA